MIMKMFFLILAICLFAIKSNAQKVDSAAMAKLSASDQELVKTYLKTAKKAKTTAFILLGGGIVLEGVAVATYANAENDHQKGASAVLAFSGAAAILGSIPFFLNARHHSELANAILYADKPVSVAPGVVIPNSATYGVRIAIPIGR